MIPSQVITGNVVIINGVILICARTKHHQREMDVLKTSRFEKKLALSELSFDLCNCVMCMWVCVHRGLTASLQEGVYSHVPTFTDAQTIRSKCTLIR